jgi:ribonuclease HII
MKLSCELRLLEKYSRLCGVDEVGRGCLAGPVCVAACVLDYDLLKKLPKNDLKLIRDSKTLSETQREISFEICLSVALDYRVEFGEASDIDEFGLNPTIYSQMSEAVHGLKKPPDLVLVDGVHKIPGVFCEQMACVKGDATYYCVAAASILAKVSRDRILIGYDKYWPEYGFSSHKGYGTKEHLKALKNHGVLEVHRRSFRPVSECAEV